MYHADELGKPAENVSFGWNWIIYISFLLSKIENNKNKLE